MDVYWTPIGGNSLGDKTLSNLANFAWFDPEPAFKSIAHDRDPASAFLQCPAMQDYYRNTFLVRCPIDLTLRVEKDYYGKEFVTSDQVNYGLLEGLVVLDRDRHPGKYPILQVSTAYALRVQESVVVEQLPPMMEPEWHINPTYSHMMLIPGMFDVSKWIRPFVFAVELTDISRPIVFKRGDPWFYIRFRTSEKVNLIKDLVDDELINIMSGCSNLKAATPQNTMALNYQMAASTIKSYKDKFFGSKKTKSKCPFSNLWNR